MNKEFIKKSGYAFVRFLGIIWLGMLINILAFFFIPFFISRTHSTVLSILSACIFFVSMYGGCFFLARSDGYKSGLFLQKNDFKEYIVVLLLHVLYGFLFKFAIYTSGAAYDIAHLIWDLCGNTVHGIGSAPFWLYLGLLIALDGIYLTAVILGRRVGVQRRLKDRQKLLSE